MESLPTKFKGRNYHLALSPAHSEMEKPMNDGQFLDPLDSEITVLIRFFTYELCFLVGHFHTWLSKPMAQFHP